MEVKEINAEKKNRTEVINSDMQVAAEVKFHGGNTVTFIDQGYGYMDIVERKVN